MNRLDSMPACVLFSLMVVLLLYLHGCTHTAPFRDNQGRIVPGSIAAMEAISIGGFPQHLWFRGIDTHNPALLIVHGGPGASEAALYRHFNSELEQHFLVVNWEQRGTGRSFHTDIPPGSMTIAQFLRDLDEVVELIRTRFHKNNVVLLGESWGTALGTIYASQHPDKVAAYVGVGQVADMPQGERLSYDYALRQATAANNEKAAKELNAIGSPPHTVDEMLVSRRWVERFGGSFHADLSTGKLIWAALNTDEANLVDLILFGRGNRFSLEHLWPEFSQLDLAAYTTFAMPIFFVIGRYDRQVPSILAASYFQTIEAPYKQLIWFERSAHHPPFEQPEEFNRVMTKDVLSILWRSSEHAWRSARPGTEP
ncbi:MAG: alpha/beta hydrolase [Nitrospira sp.]|nr:alpha/beta hydrolase [Nitrospira sp.]